MIEYTDSDFAVLRDFARVAMKMNIPFVLIGAGARLMTIDWQRAVYDQRATMDWDFGVQLQDLEAYRQLKEALSASGYFADTPTKHRMEHKNKIMVDFIPFGEIEAPEGVSNWQGEEQSVYGYAEAYKHALPIDVGEGITIPVANEPSFMILKIFAFYSRDENKDIRDIQFLLNNYIYEKNEVVAEEELFEHYGEVTEETVGPWLLGKDVAAIIKDNTFQKIVPIFNDLFSEDSQAWARLVRPRRLTEEEELDARELEISKFRTFLRSLMYHYEKSAT